MPTDKKDFSKILPKSRYRIEQTEKNEVDLQTDRLSSTSLGKR